MLNSQPSVRGFKRPMDDITELLESSRHKEPRLNYSTGLAGENNMFSSQPLYNQQQRMYDNPQRMYDNPQRMYDNQITQAELLEKNYTVCFL
jgi:hypothetical protein